MHAHIQDESLFVENLSIPQPPKIIENAYLLKYNFKDCLKKKQIFLKQITLKQIQHKCGCLGAEPHALVAAMPQVCIPLC